MQKLKQEQEDIKDARKIERLRERQLKTLEKDKRAVAEKAKAKVEKLRRKLEKEERRVAKAEAKSLKRSAAPEPEVSSREAKRLRSQSDKKVESVENHSESSASVEPTKFLEEGGRPFATVIVGPCSPRGAHQRPADDSQAIPEKIKEEPPSLTIGPLTPTSQPAMPEHETEAGMTREPNLSGDLADPDQPPGPAGGNKPYSAGTRVHEEENLGAISAASSEMSVSSDGTLSGDEDDNKTSSSESSSSDSDSEGPETATSRRLGPRKVPPPRKNDRRGRAVCRDFLRTGRCRRGTRCRWRHALPDRRQSKADENITSRPERKSLHQRVCILLSLRPTLVNLLPTTAIGTTRGK